MSLIAVDQFGAVCVRTCLTEESAVHHKNKKLSRSSRVFEYLQWQVLRVAWCVSSVVHVTEHAAIRTLRSDVNGRDRR